MGQASLIPDRYLRNGLRIAEILVGYACNARCGFCYNPPLTPELLAQELSLEQVAILMREARLNAYNGVWLTGGEPCLRKDIPQMLLLARKLGFEHIQIGTNGVRLSSLHYAKKLAASGLNFAKISLHSRSAPVHDGILGIQGAFAAAVKAVSNLRALGVSVSVNFVVTSRNYKEIPDFFRFCLKELELAQFDVIFLHERGMMKFHQDLGVSYSEVVPYLRQAFSDYSAFSRPVGFPILINIPPCVAPELEPWISDWSVCENPDSLAHSSDRSINLGAMKSAQRKKAASCSECIWDVRCLGFERDYARRWGESEFRPIISPPGDQWRVLSQGCRRAPET